MVLINRFKETRRKHPLLHHSLTPWSRRFRWNVGFSRRQSEEVSPLYSDYLLSISQSAQAAAFETLFLGNASEAMVIHCVPLGSSIRASEADLMFDVRCLPNPFYVPELKKLTGLIRNVRIVRTGRVPKILKRSLLGLII